MQNMFSRIRNPALRYGLMFGLILFVIEIVLSFLAGLLGAFITLLSLAAYLVLAFLAGQRASQETGLLRTGLLAGFWTGVFGELISAILSLILTFLNLDTIRQSNQNYAAKTLHETPSQVMAITNAAIINNLLLQLAVSIVIASLLGLLAGAIGGYMGRKRAAPPRDPYQEAMFEPPSTTTRQ